MRKSLPREITVQGMIAAIYVVLNLLLQPISFGPLQCRVSEALTVLPFLDPFCTIGLTVGCLISNLLGGMGILDVIFGVAATFLAGIATSKMKRSWLAPLPPVILNAVIVGAVLTAVSVPKDLFFPTFWLYAGEVGAGEIGACYILGLPLMNIVKHNGLFRTR